MVNGIQINLIKYFGSFKKKSIRPRSIANRTYGHLVVAYIECTIIVKRKGFVYYTGAVREPSKEGSKEMEENNIGLPYHDTLRRQSYFILTF